MTRARAKTVPFFFHSFFLEGGGWRVLTQRIKIGAGLCRWPRAVRRGTGADAEVRLGNPGIPGTLKSGKNVTLSVMMPQEAVRDG